MDELDKVEQVREKTQASYEDAKAALDAHDGNVLDAIIELERSGKAHMTSASYASYSTQVQEQSEPVSPEMGRAQEAYRRSVGTSEFWEGVKNVFRKSIDYKLIVLSRGEEIIRVPVLVPICGLLFWGATIWILIVGLFFGLRYRIVGDASTVANNINDAMDTAADAAETIKQDVAAK